MATNWPTWTCALAPGALKDLTPLIELEEKVLKLHPKNPDYFNTLGAVLNRAGHFQAAGEKFREAIRLKEGNENPEDGLFLAMTEHALGHEAEARRWLEQGIKWLEALESGRRADTRDRLSSQSQRVQLQIIRREAEGVVTGAP